MRRPLPLLLGGALLAGLLSPRIIPYDMDEFAAFHPLGCRAFPLSRALNVYRERCGGYDLTPPLLGRPLPLRSYLYIGSLPVIPFWPFWRAFGDPVSVRVQGALLLVVAIVLVRSLLRTGYGPALAAVFLFPVYPLSFLVDTGPVGLCLVLLLSSLLLFRLSIETPHFRLGSACAAGAGLALFLGLWVKLVFMWCIPAVVIVVFFWALGRPSRAHWRRPLLALVVLLPLGGALLFARTVDGARYLDVVRRGGISLDPEDVAGVARTLAVYLTDGSAVLPRIFSFPPSWLDFCPGIAALTILAFGFRDTELQVYGGAAATTFLVTDLSTRALEAHHAVFFMTFLVLALGKALAQSSHARRGAALAIAILWGSLALRLPRAEIDPRRNFEKDALLEDIRRTHLDQRTLALHSSWGTYYIAHLFGDPEQAVLFSKKFPENAAMLSEVKELATRMGRGILVVTRKAERLQDGPIREVLGPPVASLQEGNWSAVEYLR
jgi:hypothetical protein